MSEDDDDDRAMKSMMASMGISIPAEGSSGSEIPPDLAALLAGQGGDNPLMAMLGMGGGNGDDNDMMKPKKPNAQLMHETRNLLSKFFHLLDAGADEKIAALFIYDGEIVIERTGKVYHGAEELAQFVRDVKSRFPNTMHIESNTNISFNGGQIRNFSYWQGFSCDTGALLSMGMHIDEFEIDILGNDEVLFSKRIITHAFPPAADPTTLASAPSYAYKPQT